MSAPQAGEERAAQLERLEEQSAKSISSAAYGMSESATAADTRLERQLEGIIEDADKILNGMYGRVSALGALFGAETARAFERGDLELLRTCLHTLATTADSVSRSRLELRAAYDNMLRQISEVQQERAAAVEELGRLYAPGARIDRTKPPEWLGAALEDLLPF